MLQILYALLLLLKQTLLLLTNKVLYAGRLGKLSCTRLLTNEQAAHYKDDALGTRKKHAFQSIEQQRVAILTKNDRFQYIRSDFKNKKISNALREKPEPAHPPPHFMRIGGFDDLVKLDRASELDKLLKG